MILILLSCGRNEPLSTYEPKSPQEAALKRVLLEFENDVNRRDAKKIESLIHEDASIMVGREQKMLSKAEYRKEGFLSVQ
jgi:ketosteroid isomerase-like protein